MRLYRGLKQPFDPERLPEPAVPGAIRSGTDFTDCPFAALAYASGRRGVMIVLDLPNPPPVWVSEETWSLDTPRARRMMVWGRYAKYVVAEIPAKELRVQVRRKGVGAQSDAYKGALLADFIKHWIRDSSATASATHVV